MTSIFLSKFPWLQSLIKYLNVVHFCSLIFLINKERLARIYFSSKFLQLHHFDEFFSRALVTWLTIRNPDVKSKLWAQATWEQTGSTGKSFRFFNHPRTQSRSFNLGNVQRHFKSNSEDEIMQIDLKDFIIFSGLSRFYKCL